MCVDVRDAAVASVIRNTKTIKQLSVRQEAASEPARLPRVSHRGIPIAVQVSEKAASRRCHHSLQNLAIESRPGNLLSANGREKGPFYSWIFPLREPSKVPLTSLSAALAR